MINVIIIIEKTAENSWDVTLTKTANSKLILCMQTIVVKMGSRYVFEADVEEADAKYIESLLNNQ